MNTNIFQAQSHQTSQQVWWKKVAQNAEIYKNIQTDPIFWASWPWT
jgi:hypothetical protein